MPFKTAASIILCAILAAAPQAGLAAEPAPAAPEPSAQAAMPAAQESGPAAASASAAPPSAPVIRHEPELVSESPRVRLAWLAIGGAAALAALAALLFLLRCRRRRMDGVRNAQAEFWNPVRIVPFHKDSEPQRPEAGGLEAVSKTVDAVMEAEARARRSPESAFEAAAEAARRMAGESPQQEMEEAAGPWAAPDAGRALEAFLAVKLQVAGEFLERGLVAEARELAQDVRREPGAGERLKRQAAELLDRAGSAKDK